jgi:glycosyltransferase involved in cell wall biosynthesis
MTYSNQIAPSNSTRVLFLAWGYSIHGKRRIQTFVDDPRFEVMVVSTFNYKFGNAKNVLLVSAGGKQTESTILVSLKDHTSDEAQAWDLWRKMKRGIFPFLKKLIMAFTASPSLEVVRNKIIGTAKSVLRFGLMIQDLQLLKLAVKQFRPDAIFLQTLLYPSYLSYFLTRSIPIIITFWNGDVIWWAKWNGIERLLKKWIVAYGVKRAGLITVNSQKAFDACLRYMTNKEKIRIVRYPGVDLGRFKPIPKVEARRRIEIDWQKVVLCPRGIGGHFNSEIIVEAAPAVIESYPKTLFIFAGVTVEEDLIKHQERVLRLGIEKNFLWKGMMPWEEMPIYYSCSDVMVSISSNDSLPNCMLEAMACHIPVIMGDISQIREWIQDGFNGFLVPPHDPDLLSDRILRVFENTDSIIDRFIERNQEMVSQEADSRKNKEVIKELVLQFTKNRFPNV